MSEPFLIAHVVRGQPAFDVAIKMDCPACTDPLSGTVPDLGEHKCSVCNNERFWWIIPTSGHRARPYWIYPLRIEEITHIAADKLGGIDAFPVHFCIPPAPAEWPDHYAVNDRPTRDRDTHREPGKLGTADLLKDLGL